MAGQAVAQVTEDVYDADGVGRLLIPQGTRVVGVYKTAQAMTFDRKRLDFGWTEMTLPDGTQIDLGQADGGDASGAAGVGGQGHDARGANVIATAALLSVFDADGHGARPPPPATRRADADRHLRRPLDLGRRPRGHAPLAQHRAQDQHPGRRPS